MTTEGPPRLLVVEDDRRLGAVLERALSEEGFVVEVVVDGAVGLQRLLEARFDVCIVDGMLPGLDGLDVVRGAHAADVAVPVLLLTARDSVADRVQGLDAGADDYLGKPFAFSELVARLRALLRRTRPATAARPGLLQWSDIELDVDRHEVRRGGGAVALSSKQFAMLELLMRLRGDVASRGTLLEQVFGYRFDPGTNIVDVHISHLRQRLDRAGERSTIETVRGVGYRMASDAP